MHTQTWSHMLSSASPYFLGPPSGLRAGLERRQCRRRRVGGQRDLREPPHQGRPHLRGVGGGGVGQRVPCGQRRTLPAGGLCPDQVGGG